MVLGALEMHDGITLVSDLSSCEVELAGAVDVVKAIYDEVVPLEIHQMLESSIQVCDGVI